MNEGTTHVALDDSKRKVVVAILRPGATEPEQREMPKEPHFIRRLFQRLTVPHREELEPTPLDLDPHRVHAQRLQAVEDV